MWLSACLNSHKVPLDAISVLMSRLFGKYWPGQVWSRQVNTWVKFDHKKTKNKSSQNMSGLFWQMSPKSKGLASLTGVCVCIQTKEAHHKHESCWQHQSLELLYCLRTWLARQLWENKNIKLEETVPGVHWRNHSRINTFFFQSSDLRKAVEGQQHVSDWLLDQQPEILHQKL